MENNQDQAHLIQTIQSMKERFHGELPAKLEHIHVLLMPFLKNISSEEDREILHRSIHSLVGSGGIFGMPEVSTVSRNLLNKIHEIETLRQTGEALLQEASGYFEQLKTLSTQEDTVIADIVDSEKIVDSIGHVKSDDHHDDPLRVLVVNDDIDQSAFYTQILQGAGMQVHEEHHSPHVLEALDKFNPDIVLLDLYMPDMNGTEVASAIREQGILSIPIVFLSAEKSAKVQRISLFRGGNDFLTKPVDPVFLINALLPKAVAYRKIKDGMSKDGYMVRSDYQAMAIARLNDTLNEKSAFPVSVCMALIDNFKSIGDTYGDQTCNHIVNSMIIYFRSRFKQKLVVELYDKNRVLIILPNTTIRTAELGIQRLIEEFSSLAYTTPKGQLYITCSCGIAVTMATCRASSLIDQVLRVVDKARNLGGNRVMSDHLK